MQFKKEIRSFFGGMIAVSMGKCSVQHPSMQQDIPQFILVFQNRKAIVYCIIRQWFYYWLSKTHNCNSNNVYLLYFEYNR